MVDLSSAPVLPGETLAGKYKVERVLGRGGMGVVVAARHLELDERVAIKFLVGDAPPGAIERFQREARAAAKVKSEHVCRVHDVGKLETGEPYIVMEHLEGEDLAERLEREGPQPHAMVVGWIIEACDALAEAHALGIVHRDLKPPNLFLAKRPDGSTCTKVLDFGISKIPSGQAMTSTQVMMGSPAYMSPEQIESSRDVDARADIWSLGATMYELLTGEQPFQGETMMQLAVQIREKAPVPVVERNPAVPQGLGEVIEKCLGKLPADRYSSVVSLASALAPYAPQEVSSVSARLARRSTPRSNAEIAHAATAREGSRPESSPDLRPASASTPDSGALSKGLRDRNATFNPVQSAAHGEDHARARARTMAAVGFAAAAIAAFIGFRVTRSPSSPDANVASPSVTTQTAPPVATSAASVIAAPSSATASASAEPIAAPSLASAPPAPSLAPSAARGRRPHRADSPPDKSAAPGPATSAEPAVATPPPSAAPATSAPGKRRRELDRNDPF